MMFVGKTIRYVDTTAWNVWVFHFYDGSEIEMEVEATGVPGLYGMVAREKNEISRSK